MRKAVLATVTVGLMLGGTGIAVAAEPGGSATGDAGRAATAVPSMLSSGQAANAALRLAGGGRVNAVRLAATDGGGASYTVQLVRGNRLMNATVDAFTGQVTSIANAGRAGSQAGGTGRTGNNSGKASGVSDDDGDDDDGDDDAEDDGDGGPVRQGVEGNK
jgi:hypothetical protein